MNAGPLALEWTRAVGSLGVRTELLDPQLKEIIPRVKIRSRNMRKADSVIFPNQIVARSALAVGRRPSRSRTAVVRQQIICRLAWQSALSCSGSR